MRRSLLATLSFLTCVFGAALAPAAPVISELLADNEAGLRDEDNELHDWLEIFNPDASAADLSGYYLTDDELDLTKWEIPATTILGSNEFLVIFASDKNRTIAGSNLHTNFRLDNGGEYLALIAPDGVTVVSEYTPAFPAQFDDSSYGFEQTPVTIEEFFVDQDDACKVLVPTGSALGLNWNKITFDDNTWTNGTLGVGYERSSGYEGVIGTNVEQEMFDQNGSVYIRIPFTVTNVDEIIGLELQMQYDDGFAAFLNGVRVMGANGLSIPSWNANATFEHPDVDALDFQSFSLDSHLHRLVEGDNVLAIHGLNIAKDDDDMLIRPRLIANRITGVTIGNEAYFTTPTPGSLNGVQDDLPTSKVLFSVKSKTFTDNFDVTLSSQFENETIRYTLNRAVPSSSSPVYTGPITITNSTQLRARVFSAENAAGPPAMESYLKVASSLSGFSSNLPIVILENWQGGQPSTGSLKDTFWAIIEPDELTDNRAGILDPLKLATRAGVKIRGSSSAGFAKYSMAVESQDETSQRQDKSVKPLGLPRESDWILSGRFRFDLALMRNPLIYQLSNDAGEYAVRTRFVEVFNNTGGGSLSYNDYFGIYSLMEKIKRDDDRVPIARPNPRPRSELDRSGGFMFKKDRADPGDNVAISPSRMGTLRWVEPKSNETSATQRSWLLNWLNEMETALYHPSWRHTSRPSLEDPTLKKHFTEYLDQDSWIRHHWLNTLAKNVDGFRLSGYYYKHRNDTNGGKLGAGPIWDFDRTMNSANDGRSSSPSGWDGTGDSSKTWNDSRYVWWGQVMKNPDLRQAHTDLWQELRKTVFSTAHIETIINGYARELQSRDPSGTNVGFQRAPDLRNFAKWTQNPPRGGSHRGEVNILKQWLRSRVDWIDSQYTEQPTFSISPGLVDPGTQVTLNGSTRPADANHIVYYTTDGSDPRLPRGTVSPSASSSMPITVDSTTVIRARSYDPTPITPPGSAVLTHWSGPVQASYLVGPLADASNFVITEVHYAPLPAATPAEMAEATDASDFEFLEMMNISPTDTIDLTDVHFEVGIEFTFTGSAITSLAPGERVLIVCNQAAFEARYGTSFSDRIAGEFAPTRLENAGERLHLVDGLGGTIADFTYNDKVPWPSEAGFAGYSMILKPGAIPGPDYNYPGNWRSSGLLGGNPNSSDSTSLVGDPEDDDDNDQLNKLIEHAMGTSDSDPSDAGGIFSIAIQPVEVNNVTDDYLTVTYRQNLLADDVTLLPEFAFDLVGWIGGPVFFPLVSEENQGDGTALVTRRVIFPHNLDVYPEVYLRMKATKLD